ncbi:MAG TPA: hypothetical protein VIS99_14240 [Terrimicrobiaceae bacterium]
MLRLAREGVHRHCRLVSETRPPELEAATGNLLTWLNTAFRAVAKARTREAASQAEDTEEIGRERKLADEFISMRFIAFIADSQAMVDGMLGAPAASDGHFRPTLALVNESLTGMVEVELNYRRVKGYVVADLDSTQSLEQFVDRRSRLKKNFEAVHSLDRVTYPVEQRLHFWLACFAALLGGTCAFAMQTMMLRSAQSMNWSLIGLTVLMGISYAMRDRIKEALQGWLTARVYRLYAQRVVRCFRPGCDRLLRKYALVQAREWCHQTTSSRPDPLNPESEATLRVTFVKHVHRGVIVPEPRLVEGGVRYLRHFFRYDLTPVLARLQDPFKSIPIFDPESGRSKFIDAPRRYQMLIRVRATTPEEKREVKAAIVLDKRGIVRIEHTSDSPEDQGVL